MIEWRIWRLRVALVTLQKWRSRDFDLCIIEVKGDFVRNDLA